MECTESNLNTRELPFFDDFQNHNEIILYSSKLNFAFEEKNISCDSNQHLRSLPISQTDHNIWEIKQIW